MKMIFLYINPFLVRVTTHSLQVDLLRTVTLPHLQLFGISDGLELRVCRIAMCFGFYQRPGLDKKTWGTTSRRW